MDKMISVLVMSKNNADTLVWRLPSVVDSAPPDREVIVVDNHFQPMTHQKILKSP
jgi:glycosyltransferase involved in cell wall biosynthesis